MINIPGGLTNRPAQFDAFQRFRVSSPYTLFDSKQVADKQALQRLTGTTEDFYGTLTFNDTL
jgi:hypothetical protein